MSQSLVTKQLTKHFQQSPIFLFFESLKTPEAASCITYTPTSPIFKFQFSLNSLSRFCPSLNIHNSRSFHRLSLRSAGLYAEYEGWEKVTLRVGHPDLDLDSGRDEVMKVWLEAKIQGVLNGKRRGGLARIYNAVCGGGTAATTATPFAQWNPSGSAIIMPKLPHNHIYDYQFKKISTQTETETETFKHPFLTLNSKPQAWLAVYLRYHHRKMVSEVKRNRSKIIEVGEISASLREAALQCVSAYVRGMIAEIGERTGVVREELRVCGEICGRFLEELESI